MKVKSESEGAQSCPTLSDLMDCSLPGSSVHGIFQARVLERGSVSVMVNGLLIYTLVATHKRNRVLFYKAAKATPFTQGFNHL